MPMHNADHTCKLCGGSYLPATNRDGSLRRVKFPGHCVKCMRVVYARERRKRNPHPPTPWPKEIRQCKCCGAEFLAETATSFYCAPSCKWESKRERQKADVARFYETRRARDSRRRARKRVGCAEKIVAREVFERDGFICHVCGEPTVFDPSTRSKTSDPRTAELEHIIPLAEGGQHVWSNVACSCRACNRAKGTKAFGQLHLPFGPKRTWPEVRGAGNVQSLS